MIATPLISVLMSVYNGEDYLRESIDSILGQTLTDFEFIIVDDGSVDGTSKVLNSVSDPRVVRINNQKNFGLSASLNKGISIARGRYIARMDADDISLPCRLEKQMVFMEEHLDIAVCGTWVELIGDVQATVWKHPLEYSGIYSRLLFSNPLVHSSVMIRASAFHANRLLYDDTVRFAQDYDLWSRSIEKFRFANIGQVLLYYRIHNTQTGVKHFVQQRETNKDIYYRMLVRLNIQPNSEDILFHQRLGMHHYESESEFFHHARRWLETLRRANRETRLIFFDAFEAELGERWTEVCHASNANIFFLVLTILASPLRFCGSYGISKLKPLIKFTLQRLQNELTKTNG